MDNPKLLYLSILLIVLLSSYLIAMRDNLPKLINDFIINKMKIFGRPSKYL